MKQYPTEKGPNDQLNAVSGSREVADWQLPDGVSRGTWDYSQKTDVAENYDGYHKEHPLLQFDQRVIEKFFPRLAQTSETISSKNEPRIKTHSEPPDDSPLVIDLGCGTGRSILPLAKRGYRTLGVDLSSKMLEIVHQKAIALNQQHPEIPINSVATLESNIVHMDEVESKTARGVLCLFSSFGMIQGRGNRLQMLSHVHRVLREDGLFLLHVHNRGNWWFDPKGSQRIFSSWWRAMKNRFPNHAQQFEMGDRVYNYRGIPNFFLHIYSRGELLRDLRASNLNVRQWIWLDRKSAGPLSHNWLLPRIRSGGMIVACEKQ